MSPQMTDRRRFPRMEVNRGVKLYDPRSRRYRSGVTVDFSRSGALIEIRNGVDAEEGQPVELLVDWTGSNPVACREDLMPASITRFETGSRHGTQRLAVAFEQPAAMPLAA